MSWMHWVTQWPQSCNSLMLIGCQCVCHECIGSAVDLWVSIATGVPSSKHSLPLSYSTALSRGQWGKLTSLLAVSPVFDLMQHQTLLHWAKPWIPQGYRVGGSNYHVCVLPHLCHSRSGLLLMEVTHFRSSSPSHLGKQWPNLHLVLRLLRFSQTLEEYSMAGRGPHGLHSWTDFLCPRIQQNLCLTLQEYWLHWSPVIRHVHAVFCLLIFSSSSTLVIPVQLMKPAP